MHVHSVKTSIEQKARVAFVPVGETELEFLESTSPEGAIARFIDKNGEGIQHICLRVDNIEEALADLKAKGVRLINEEPRPGAASNRTKIAFIHPKETHGVLLELLEQIEE
jgi:methylmalonyl-CoA/ethylmalonyl-CoA epimerase